VSKAKAAAAEEAAEKHHVPEPIQEEESIQEDPKEAAQDAEEPKPVSSSEVEVKELEIGDKLPDLSLKNEKDQEVAIAHLAGEKGLVLFLIPRADTSGCNTQACGFRDSYTEFEKYGYAVFALSSDTPAAQAKWQTKKNLGYSLLSDPKRKLIQALGAKSGATTKRSHVIFEKGTGKLVEKKLGVKPADSPKQALEFVKKHHPETT